MTCVWLAFMLALSIVKNVTSCGPQLKPYFGDKFVLNNLTTGYTGNPIAKSSDLNCDFQNAAVCRWNNSELDQFEWYLGTGQVKPGGWATVFSTAQEATFPFVLAPSENRKNLEDSAWFVSDPILCQKGSGTLQFRYWTRNSWFTPCVINRGTLKAVVCYDAVKQGQQSPGPLSWVIPGPIPQEFQLAIRAFHYNAAPGGIIAVDNIVYTADICSPADLGGSYTNEPLPLGLTGKPIIISSEANCDFTGTCRWGNGANQAGINWVKGSGNPSPTTWPMQTGTTEIPTEPFAIVHGPAGSSPDTTSLLITDYFYCQIGDGKATFRYWLGRGARLQFCALERSTLNTITCTELPASDASIVKTVTIGGSINTEFILAFKAYNFSDPIGSFVVVDDFKYDAKLCTSPGDLGGTLTTSPMPNGLTGQYLKTSSEANCNFDGDSCRWGDGGGSATWQKTSGTPDKQRWTNLTGTSQLPSGSFALVYVNGTGPALLRSDPIACQNGDGQVTFRFWLTSGASLYVCTIKIATKEENCLDPVARSNSPGPVTVSIPGPIDDDFYLQYRAVGTQPNDFVAIDDVSYKADICDQTSPTSNLGGTFTMSPLKSGLTGQYLELSREANCEFSATCRWGNANGNGPQWQQGNGAPNPTRWKKYTNSDVLPEAPFAILPLTDSSQQGDLVTDPIKCQRGAGKVTFNYWLTQGAMLQICAQSASGIGPCETVSAPQSGSHVITLPGDITQEYRLLFRASGTQPGFAAVDNIVYDAELCSATTTTSTTTTTPPTTPAPPTNNTSACIKLKCDFENDGQCKGYKLTFNSTGWHRTNDRYGPARNQLIGTVDGGQWYIASPIIDYGQKTVLASEPFPALNQPVTLSFVYNRATYGTKLSVCTDAQLQHCTEASAPQLTIDEARSFKQTSVTLPSGTTQIFFVYEATYAAAGKAAVGIDVITLLDPRTLKNVC